MLPFFLLLTDKVDIKSADIYLQMMQNPRKEHPDAYTLFASMHTVCFGEVIVSKLARLQMLLSKFSCETIKIMGVMTTGHGMSESR